MKEYILSSCASILSIYFILNNNYIKNLFDFKKTQPKQILNNIQKNPNSSQKQQPIEMKIQSPTNIENTTKINNINLSSSSDLGSLCMDTLSYTSLLSEPTSYIEKEKTQKNTTPIIENKPIIQKTKTYNIDTKNIKDNKDKKKKKAKKKKKDKEDKEDKNNAIEYVNSPINDLIFRTYNGHHL